VTQGIQNDEFDKTIIGDTHFWMRSCFHSRDHVPNVSQQAIRKIYQLLMSEVIQQWKLIIKHNFCPSLTSNVLDEVEENISAWLGE